MTLDTHFTFPAGLPDPERAFKACMLKLWQKMPLEQIEGSIGLILTEWGLSNGYHVDFNATKMSVHFTHVSLVPVP